jgi:L-lactate dehydrogenase
MKISIIGLGKVGSATAFALVSRGVPHELILVGRNKEKTFGDAYDLLHAAALIRTMKVSVGEVADTAGSDIVILAISILPGDGRDRTANALGNAQLIQELVPPLATVSPNAVFVVMTNPVDAMTYVTAKSAGLPSGRVLGTGTLLDTARFRALLSGDVGIDAADIRAYILGEHGDSQFAALSVASSGGVRIEPEAPNVHAYLEETRYSGYRIAAAKGFTNYGVAMAAVKICEAIAHDSRTIMPVSTMVEGVKGLRDVCLSLPCVIGRQGVERILEIDLNDRESTELQASAAVIRLVIQKINAAS